MKAARVLSHWPKYPLAQAQCRARRLSQAWTWGDWLQGLVQEEHLLVGAGGADGDALVVGKVPLNGIPGAVHSDFRWDHRG